MVNTGERLMRLNNSRATCYAKQDLKQELKRRLSDISIARGLQ
jgi:hypothetical protein